MFLNLQFDDGMLRVRHSHLGLTEIQAATLQARYLMGDQDARAELINRGIVVAQQLKYELARGSC